LSKAIKFRVYLVTLIICVVGFIFSPASSQFYTNPFYIGSFVFAIALIIIVINYFCPNCRKNQVIQSATNYRLPTNKCYHCEEEIN
jgi:undecaprenyl pyrophosphate phosphatase UppP